MRAEHPVELRADLQRYFGLDLSRMGQDFTVWHAAACAACLPLGSATLARIDRRLQWTAGEVLLCAIRNLFAAESVQLDGFDNGSDGLPEFGELPRDEFMEWYSKPRKEAGCQAV